MKRKWDVGSEEQHRKCVEEILTRLQEQGMAEFGIIAAGDIISIVLQNYGPDIYNLALADARKLIETKLADISTDLDVLVQSD
ncbi:DUF2164 family protein [Candidatus Saccharibacteria bacterium]|nr:MAG: DUF2164 family protein [Candidatus Saccharibacteria bacterium]